MTTKKQTFLLFSIILSIIILSSFSLATSINLLAAVEGNDLGNVIKASLETKEGSGKIFIEANLLSNPDTQVSIKIANEIVCSNYFDCSNHDFYYTIDSNSVIVTGPSGGAGLALLTYSHLFGKDISNEFAISGTINSGGYIGNVGGLKEKILAAKKNDIDTVLIPFTNQNYIDFSAFNFTNSSLNLNLSNLPKTNLSVFGQENGVNVVPVSTFDDVLEIVFKIPKVNYTIEKPEFYTNIMSKISTDICSDTEVLLSNSEYIFSNDYSNFYCFNNSNCTLPKISNESYTKYTNISYYITSANELYNYSLLSKSVNDFYSSASYCFGANMKLRYVNFLTLPINESIKIANESIADANAHLKSNFLYLNDIQTYSVVKERIFDAQDSFSKANELLSNGKVLESIDQFAYATERAKTAIAWSNFYDVPKTKKIMGSLDTACSLAFRDANSRIQYIKLYLNYPLESETTLLKAKESQDLGDYAMCIYYSLESKAESEIVSSILGADEEQLSVVLNVKEEIAKKFIAKQYVQGNYPILGYSYLEYGTSLKNTNPYSALLYFQMAQELSNLDLFLEVEQNTSLNNLDVSLTRNDLFLIGLAVGMLFTALCVRIESFYRLKKSSKKLKN